MDNLDVGFTSTMISSVMVMEQGSETMAEFGIALGSFLGIGLFCIMLLGGLLKELFGASDCPHCDCEVCCYCGK